MKYNSLSNQAFAALANGLPVPLTITMEGTGSATGWITGNKLYVLCVDAQVGKYVNVSTPIDFDIINVETIHGDANDCAVQCLNTASAISDAIAIAASDTIAIAASDTDIDRATTIDNAYNSFSADDDDLRFAITTDAFVGLIICTIDK